jgi:hypothetical protein
MPRTLAPLLIAAVLLLGACHSGSQARTPRETPATATDTATLDRNHGYALLYGTISDESDVDKVLIIKNPSTPVKDVIKAIGEFARTSKTGIENLAKEDPPIALEDAGLPIAETKTREAISKATSSQIILHGSKELEFRLLLTQHEALNYINHLAKTTADLEPRENRKTFLTGVAKDAASLHERVLTLMKTPYVGAPK